MRRSAATVFIFLLVLCLAHAAYYYPLLPERVASHFGASGQPDAWSSKWSFMKTYLAMLIFMGILFPGMGLLFSRIPAQFINMPNKDYWLSTERRKQTLDDLSRQLLWFGSATLLLMLDMMHQTFMVHLGKANGLNHALTSIAVYVAFSVIWGIGLIVKFMRKP